MGAQYIKPEHLSTVISASSGDFLIVIGDRNMKNDTCQVHAHTHIRTPGMYNRVAVAVGYAGG